MYQSVPKHTGIYHIRDNIECLELEVRFRHVNSLLKLPKFEHSSSDKRSGTKKQSSVDETDNVSITRIRWQQKLLSPSELELYKEVHNCITDTQKKYHRWLLAEHEVEDVSEAPVILGRRGQKRKSRSKKQKQKYADADAAADAAPKWGEVFSYVHEDNFKPEQFSTAQPQLTAACNDAANALPVEHMYVYAATKPDTQLLALRWHPQQRQLHIYPDFNDFEEQPYYIEIDTDYRHLYAYGVRNVSMRRHVTSATALPLLQLPELPTHWQLERDLSAQFAMPPKRTKRVALLFELRTATDFAHCNRSLHVRYHTQLPAHTLLEEGALQACTHASTPNAAGVFQYGYNWQLTLLCEEDYNAAHLLHVHFELISIDSWARERAEGYAHYATYLLPGYETVELQCLRPAESVMDALNRYFIGGRRKFDFVRYFTDPAHGALDEKENGVALQSRYGCRIQSTGQLELCCQRISQRNCELLQPCSNRASGMTLDDIMLAYREARQRLEAVVLK